MTERPYVWHVSKFPSLGTYTGPHPWTVSLGKPKGDMDWVEVARTLEEAMEKALKLVPKEVP